MKTHNLAKALEQLAVILKNSPNVELDSFTFKPKTKHKELSKEEIALNITTLLALSKVKKPTWVEFIEENKWPINIQYRDSSRNLIGRILKYLDGNPEAMKTLKNKTSGSKGQASTELLNALSSLMGPK